MFYTKFNTLFAGILFNRKLLDYRRFEHCHQVFPVDGIDRFLLYKLQPHKRISRSECLLMDIVGILLKVYHLNRSPVLRHKDKHVTVVGFQVMLMLYYLKKPMRTTAHIIDVGHIIEFSQTRYRQHTTSNLSVTLLGAYSFLLYFLLLLKHLISLLQFIFYKCFSYI